MDVVLTPVGSVGQAWVLKDRLGRSLGNISKTGDTPEVQIQPDASSILKSVKREHASLSDAMSAIARLAAGACTLDSGDWN